MTIFLKHLGFESPLSYSLQSIILLTAFLWGRVRGLWL